MMQTLTEWKKREKKNIRWGIEGISDTSLLSLNQMMERRRWGFCDLKERMREKRTHRENWDMKIPADTLWGKMITADSRSHYSLTILPLIHYTTISARRDTHCHFPSCIFVWYVCMCSSCSVWRRRLTVCRGMRVAREKQHNVRCQMEGKNGERIWIWSIQADACVYTSLSPSSSRLGAKHQEQTHYHLRYSELSSCGQHAMREDMRRKKQLPTTFSNPWVMHPPAWKFSGPTVFPRETEKSRRKLVLFQHLSLIIIRFTAFSPTFGGQ